MGAFENHYELFILGAEAILSLLWLKFAYSHYINPDKEIDVVIKWLFRTKKARGFDLVIIFSGLTFICALVGCLMKNINVLYVGAGFLLGTGIAGIVTLYTYLKYIPVAENILAKIKGY